MRVLPAPSRWMIRRMRMAAKKVIKKSAGKTRTAKRPSGVKETATPGGFIFANPKPSPDAYGNFSKADVCADSNVTASTAILPIPKSWRQPEVLDLAQVLSTAEAQQIKSGGSMVFTALA